MVGSRETTDSILGLVVASRNRLDLTPATLLGFIRSGPPGQHGNGSTVLCGPGLGEGSRLTLASQSLDQNQSLDRITTKTWEIGSTWY